MKYLFSSCLVPGSSTRNNSFYPKRPSQQQDEQCLASFKPEHPSGCLDPLLPVRTGNAPGICFADTHCLVRHSDPEMEPGRRWISCRWLKEVHLFIAVSFLFPISKKCAVGVCVYVFHGLTILKLSISHKSPE